RGRVGGRRGRLGSLGSLGRGTWRLLGLLGLFIAARLLGGARLGRLLLGAARLLLRRFLFSHQRHSLPRRILTSGSDIWPLAASDRLASAKRSVANSPAARRSRSKRIR